MSFTQCSAQAHPCLGYVCPNPRGFSATPRSAGTPFPSSETQPESTLGSWAGLRTLLFPTGLCPIPAAGVTLGTRELPLPEQAVPRARCLLGHLGPLLSLSAGKDPYVGHCLVTQFPHPSRGKAELLGVSMLLPADLGMEGARTEPKETQLISSRTLQGGFVQPLGEQPGSELQPQSCRAPFISLCSSALPQNRTVTGKPDRELRGWQGRHCSWGVQAGYQRGVKVHSWGSGNGAGQAAPAGSPELSGESCWHCQALPSQFESPISSQAAGEGSLQKG